MIISDEKKFVFLHNPKAAGTTVRFALNKFDSYDSKFWRNECEELGRYGDMAHLSTQSLKSFFPEEYKKIVNYYTFGFVRDPLKRFFSGFNETHKALLQRVNEEPDFMEEYKGVLKKYTETQLSCSHPEGWYTHVKPQKEVFYDEGTCIADLVVKIENPFPDVNAISNVLDSDVEHCVTKALTGKPRNKKPLSFTASDLLSVEYLNALMDYYSEDYKLFGYPLEFYKK